MKKYVGNESDRFWSLNNPIAWGVCITCFFMFFVLFLSIGYYCNEDGCSRRILVFLDSKPNEIGDTLAGISSTVAFVWIVVTVWIQSHELREQRRELRNQRKEFEKVAQAMDAQTRIFEGEEKKRRSNTYFNLLNQRIRDVLDNFNELTGKIKWDVRLGDGSEVHFDLMESPAQVSRKSGENLLNDAELDAIMDRFEAFLRIYDSKAATVEIVSRPEKFLELQEISSALIEITGFLDNLSPSSRARMQTIKIVERAEFFAQILQDNELWAESSSK